MPNDNTIKKIPQARFGINEVVYLRETSLLGYLEAVRVEGAQYDPEVDRIFYYFTFRQERLKNQTVGDANTLKHDNTIKVIEQELCTYCEALANKVSYLQRELATALVQQCMCAGPEITSIFPDTGVTAGDNIVTISGTGFTGATVTIGGVGADIDTLTNTSIILTMPSHLAGRVTIRVSTSGGEDTTTYTYSDGTDVT